MCSVGTHRRKATLCQAAEYSSHQCGHRWTDIHTSRCINAYGDSGVPCESFRISDSAARYTLQKPSVLCHACQILKHKQRILAIFLDECLRHPMVHIWHPTVLSSGKGFESTLCGFCSLSLKLFANLLKLVPFGRYLFSGNKVGFTLFIIYDTAFCLTL